MTKFVFEYIPGVTPGCPVAGAPSPARASSSGAKVRKRLASRLSTVGKITPVWLAMWLVWSSSMRTVIRCPRSPGIRSGR
ncbi:hypothetical protein GCM10017559_52430 [Streptosporangium longisporum]|uniref:Uncharacterized protein n=1 Tax=Streptosporangium longisporum TaxID=46187 RepID=A0ABN3Y6P5_9ACTN